MFFASFITSSLSSPSPPADYPPYFWPLPTTFSFGNQTFFVDPAEYLTVGESGGGSSIVSAPFERYMGIIFNHASSKERHESSVKVSPERTTLSTLNKPLSTTPK